MADKITEITIPTSSQSFDYELPEPGVYLARCYKIVDEGTHLDPAAPGAQYQAKPTRRVHIYFELLQDEEGTEVLMSNKKPFSISKRYNMSMHEKATLRADLEKWRGQKYSAEELANFKITNLLGQFALIQVDINTSSSDASRRYANISSLMKTKKTVTGFNELVSFSVNNPDMDVWATFGKWMQERINSSDELKDSPLPYTVRDDFNSEPVKAQPAAAPKKTTSVAEDLDELDKSF